MTKRVGLAMLRAKYDLTQEQIAERCGVKKATYCLIEQGKRNGTLAFWQTVQREFALTDAQVWSLQNGKSL